MNLAAILLAIVAFVVILLILDLVLAGRGTTGDAMGGTAGIRSSGIAPILLLLSTIVVVLVFALAFKFI